MIRLLSPLFLMILSALALAQPMVPSKERPGPMAREFRAAWIATAYNIDWPSKQGLSASAQQAELRDDLKALEQAGADFIVFECIPASLADELTRQTSMATIGIGAGSQTNAQVLVCYDMLGLSNSPARFVKNFLADAADSGDASISQAFRCYKDDVLAGRYPAAEHEYQ